MTAPGPPIQVRAQDTVFALIAEQASMLPQILRRAFLHPWVASYQIGFGPPLIKANPRLVARVKETRNVLDKLDAYLETTVLDREECKRLAQMHRQQLTRRLGPVEAETIDQASADALNLELRLFLPASAPPAIQAQMTATALPAQLLQPTAPPEATTGRFLIRLADPLNARLLDVEQVADAAGGWKGPLIVELRAPAAAQRLFAEWIQSLKKGFPIRTVDLGAPAAHARVTRNGQRM